MPIRENIEELMERQMDRGEFLRLAAVTMAGVIGISRVISAVSHTASRGKIDQGYGSSVYGGSDDRASFLKSHR